MQKNCENWEQKYIREGDEGEKGEIKQWVHQGRKTQDQKQAFGALFCFGKPNGFHQNYESIITKIKIQSAKRQQTFSITFKSAG